DIKQRNNVEGVSGKMRFVEWANGDIDTVFGFGDCGSLGRKIQTGYAKASMLQQAEQRPAAASDVEHIHATITRSFGDEGDMVAKRQLPVNRFQLFQAAGSSRVPPIIGGIEAFNFASIRHRMQEQTAASFT